MKEANKKKEEKIKELQEFISRFSANASKSKQATSRKRALEKIQLDEIRPSSRKYPYIDFRPNREIGNEVLHRREISPRRSTASRSLTILPLPWATMTRSLLSAETSLAKTTLFRILTGEMEPDEGSYKWGVTTSSGILPEGQQRRSSTMTITIVDWLTQYLRDQGCHLCPRLPRPYALRRRRRREAV